MEETDMKGIRIFNRAEARAIKDALSAKEIGEVQKHVQILIGNLDKLVDVLRGGVLFLRNGELSTGQVAFAAFRIQTLSLIFEYARRFIMKSSKGEALYKTFLADLGYEVGFTYGREMLRNLRIAQYLPQDDSALIKLWTLFEYETGAGITTVSKIDKHTFEITLEKNPIGYYYLENGQHHHCYFYCEYYRAILNEFLTSRPRLAQDFLPDLRPSPPIWKVVNIEEQPRKDLCVFTYKIREEKLTRAFDLLHKALTEMDDGKYGDAVAKAREALAEARKEKIFSGCEAIPRDIPEDYYKVFRSLLPKRDYDLMDDVFHLASRIIHQSTTVDIRKIQEIIRHICYCVHEIERLDIDEKQLEEIRKKLVKNA